MSTAQEQFASDSGSKPPVLGKWLMRLGFGLILLGPLIRAVEKVFRRARPDLADAENWLLVPAVLMSAGLALSGLSGLCWRHYWTDYFIWSLVRNADEPASQRAVEQLGAGGWRKPYLIMVTTATVALLGVGVGCLAFVVIASSP